MERVSFPKLNSSPFEVFQFNTILFSSFDAAKSAYHLALCDSINTQTALNTILDLVSKTNIYISAPQTYMSIATVATIARWVTKQVRLFGLDSQPVPKFGIGWSEDGESVSTSADKETIAAPYVRVLSNFRDTVRQIAMEKKTGPASKDLLSLCDRVRNEDLPPLGVSLDDRESGAALVKFVSAEQLLVEKREKEEKAAERERKKEELRRERERQEREKLEKGKVSPLVMFKEGEEGLNWSEWDEEGIPTKDKNGEPVAKNKQKNIKKAWDKQMKLHEAYEGWRQGQGEADR